jgi:hypothetical protein
VLKRQEVRYSEKMEYVCTAWFFQGLLQAHPSFSRAPERYLLTSSNMLDLTLAELTTLPILFQIYTLKHDVTNVRCLMPGLILAIRKVIRLKVLDRLTVILHYSLVFLTVSYSLKTPPHFLQNLIYGLEKFL